MTLEGKIEGRGDRGLSLPQTIALTCIPVWQTRTEVPSVSANVCFTKSQEWQHQINKRAFQVLTHLINACTKSLHVSSVLWSAATILTWECPFLLYLDASLNLKKINNNLVSSRRVSKQVLPHEFVPPRLSSLFRVQSPPHKPDEEKFFESVIKVSLKVHPK